MPFISRVLQLSVAIAAGAFFGFSVGDSHKPELLLPTVIPTGPPPRAQAAMVVSSPPQPKPKPTTTNEFVLQAVEGYDYYPTSAQWRLEKRRKNFETLPAEHIALANKLPTPWNKKLDTARDLVHTNGKLLRRIGNYGLEHYNLTREQNVDKFEGNQDVIEEIMGHIQRDWTPAGQKERDEVYVPIIDALMKAIPQGGRVMVPGAGMGRIAHEIAEKGYKVDANEYEYISILASLFLQDPQTTPYPNAHTLYPYVLDWAHQLKPTSPFSPVTFPDVVPSQSISWIPGDFLQEVKGEGVYDAVVTLFFIDTSENFFDYLQKMYKILKPGGIWINLGREFPFFFSLSLNAQLIWIGPTALKWAHWAKVTPSAAEALDLAELVGFEVDRSSHRTIETGYATRPEFLFRFVYCEF